MKIRHRIMLWVAGAGLLTSLVFSFVVFWELREQPVEMVDSQLKLAAAAVAEQLVEAQKPLSDERAITLPISSDSYYIKVYDRNLQVVYQSALSKVVDLPLQRNKRGVYMVEALRPAKTYRFSPR